MLVRDIMTHHPVRISPSATLRRAAEIISIAEVSDIMVTDDDRRFLGVVSEGDIIRAILPNFDEVINAGGTLADAFAFFIQKGAELAERSVEPLIIPAAETIISRPSDEAATAAVTMVEKQIRRLPVVEDGKLIGTISRADICRAVVYGQ